MKALSGHWRVRSESREEKHVLLWFDLTESDHKGDPKRESKSSFSPEEPKSKILKGYCVGQFCPVFKLYWRRPGPILSSFIQMEQERARPISSVRANEYPRTASKWMDIITLRGEVKHACEKLGRVQGRWSPRDFCPRYLVNSLITQSNAWDEPYNKVKGEI